jgi:hypothetical protein
MFSCRRETSSVVAYVRRLWTNSDAIATVSRSPITNATMISTSVKPRAVLRVRRAVLMD